MANQQQIMKCFKQFCEQFDSKFFALGEGVFLGRFCGKNGKWQVLCDTGSNPNDTCFHVYSILPATVPPEKQRAVMEYLTRANFGLSIGNFEMDVRDGEVCYKTSIDLADGSPTPGIVAALVFRNVYTTDHYLKGLLLVLFAGMEPATAIQARVDDDEPDGEDISELLHDVNLDRLPDGDD